jgi:ubiquinone/menaquinone biosynthesis C-methylase UbiE
MKGGDNAMSHNRYAEGKLQREAKRPDSVTFKCERLLVHLLRLGAQGPGAKVLDLGCGTGRLAVELAERGYDIYAVDINHDLVKIAQEKARERIGIAPFAIAAAELLPFRDDFFDICIVNNVLEHVANWGKTLDEVARVTKPGGMAYFDAANALYPLPNEVKYFPFFSYIPGRLRQRILNVIIARFPSLVAYSPTPARNWFTPTGLRKALSRRGFNYSWDLIDIVTKEEIPPKYRLASPLLPLLKKTPPLYVRDLAHFPLAGVRLFCRKS